MRDFGFVVGIDHLNLKGRCPGCRRRDETA
jgi:hypothetical protein